MSVKIGHVRLGEERGPDDRRHKNGYEQQGEQERAGVERRDRVSAPLCHGGGFPQSGRRREAPMEAIEDRFGDGLLGPHVLCGDDVVELVEVIDGATEARPGPRGCHVHNVAIDDVVVISPCGDEVSVDEFGVDKFRVEIDRIEIGSIEVGRVDVAVKSDRLGGWSLKIERLVDVGRFRCA